MRRTRGQGTPPPAPEAVGLVQAFVNTALPGVDREGWRSPRELARWLVGRGLLDPGVELGEGDLVRAVAVREGLRALLAGNSGGAAGGRAADALARILEDARFRLRLDHAGRARLDPVGEGPDAAFGAVFAEVVGAQVDGLWPALKLCGACRGAYYDASRGRVGKWCTPACGARIRVREFRRRRRRGG